MSTRIWDSNNCAERRWFRFLSIILIAGACVYIITHWIVNVYCKNNNCVTKYDYEYTDLSPDQLQMINHIYFGSLYATTFEAPRSTRTTSDTPQTPPATGTGQLTSILTDDSTALEKKAKKVKLYLVNEFNDKWDAAQQQNVSDFLRSATAFEALDFLKGTRFQIQSYFWLIGPSVYFEIIFWAFFGVVCSLLFSLGLISKNSTTTFNNPQSVFDSSEIPYQVAKILYAPICTMVIVLGYNFFSDQNIVDIYSSKGVIVFAFVGGFYSSRVIALMDRLKEVILPSTGTTTGTVALGTNAVKDIIIKPEIDDIATLPYELQTEITNGINDATVKLKPFNTTIEMAAIRNATDAASSYTVPETLEGIYKIAVQWEKTIAGTTYKYAAEQVAELKAGVSPVVIKLKPVV